MLKKIADIDIMRGFREAKNITASYAKTFYTASLFLDRNKRYAAYSIYAVCRISDNAVDDPKETQTAKDQAEKIKNDIEAAYGQNELREPLLKAFRKTISSYGIPKQYFDELLQGVSSDLTKNRYKDFKELYDYCYKVAGVVGLMMLKIFGSDNPDAQEHAIDMGVAMQLTNILRDIQEDFERGRIYLPQDEMEQFNIENNFTALKEINSNAKSFLKFQIERARDYYSRASAGINMISDKRCAFVACIMKDMYAEILNQIEKNGYNVFKKREYVPWGRKCAIILKRSITKPC